MNFFKNNLANAFTLANLFSGSVGVIQLIMGNYEVTAICIILSLILDFFDGFVARAMRSDSALGGQLDSLADMVSFGLLPGITMYKALEPFGNQIFSMELPFELKYIGLLITLFSCLRLAIFNLDDEQTYYFKGLNTPANTILIFGLYYAYRETNSFSLLFHHPLGLILLVILSSWILVSPIKMIAMKFRSMTLADNYPKIALVLGVIILVILFKIVAIPLAIVYYMVLSLVFQKQLN